jgi:hypothetical protein
VLAGVHKDGLDFRMALHFVHEGRDFRKVGLGPDDIQFRIFKRWVMERWFPLCEGSIASGK